MVGCPHGRTRHDRGLGPRSRHVRRGGRPRAARPRVRAAWRDAAARRPAATAGAGRRPRLRHRHAQPAARRRGVRRHRGRLLPRDGAAGAGEGGDRPGRRAVSHSSRPTSRDPPLSPGVATTSCCRGTCSGRCPTPPPRCAAGSTSLAPGGRLVLVEGHWSTGAGLTADETLALVEAAGRRPSSGCCREPAFWGREIDRRAVRSWWPAETCPTAASSCVHPTASAGSMTRASGTPDVCHLRAGGGPVSGAGVLSPGRAPSSQRPDEPFLATLGAVSG